MNLFRHPMLPVGVLFCSSCLWGLSWLPLKYLAERGLSGAALILVAYGSVALVLLPILWRERVAWRPQMVFLLMIALVGGLANLAFASSLIYGDVIRAMALFYLLPVWGILGGRIFLQETLTPARLLALALALTGAFFLLGATEIFNAPPRWIDLLAILSGLAFALNNLLFRATPQLPIASKVSAVFVGCGLLAALVLASGFQHLPSTDIGADTMTLTILFGLLGLLLATGATQWAVTHLEAGRSAIIMVMELVAAMISAAILTQATLAPHEMLGASLILMASVVEAFWGTEAEPAFGH